MDWELELKEQEEELLAFYGMNVPVTLDYEHEETPLEVGYLDQSADLWKNLWKTPSVCNEAVWGVDSIECADQIIGSLITFHFFDVID